MSETRITIAAKSWCPPNWHWDSATQNWEGQLLWLVLGGSGHLRINDADHEVGKGDFFLLDAPDRHVGSHDPKRPLVVSWAHFSTSIPLMQLPFHRRLENLPFIRDLCDRIIDAFNNPEEKNEAAETWLNALIYEALDLERHRPLTGLVREQAEDIRDICRMIRESPEKEYPVPLLAERMHYTADHFTRLFKKVTDMPPNEFVIRCRIEAAEGLLRFSTHPVGRIASLLGYNDVYFFSRQFKKWTGRSPVAYRQGV